MSFFTRILIVNAIAATVCSLLVLAGLFYFCDPDPVRLLDWIFQAAGLLIFGMLVQNFAHLKWLQRETVIHRWSPGDTQDFLFETVTELIHFPYKSVLLTAMLWIIFSMPAALMYWVTVDQSIGNALVAYSFLLAAGSTVAAAQDFYSRSFLYPHLESFIEKQERSLQLRLSKARMPFTVRAKLVLQSSFSLIVIVIVTLSAGYAIERNRLRSEQVDLITTQLNLLAPAFEFGISQQMAEESEELISTFAKLIGGSLAISHRQSHQTNYQIGPMGEGARSVLNDVLHSSRRNHPDWTTARLSIGDNIFAAAIPWRDFGGDLEYYLYLFVISFSLGSLLIFSIAFLASHDISRSVRRIDKWAEQLSAGVLKHSPSVVEDDKVAGLIFRLDALRTRLSSLLIKMKTGALDTRTVSSRVQEHAILLKQTTEEDSNLLALTASLLDRLKGTLIEHQKTVLSLSQNSEDAVSSATQMVPLLKEVDQHSLLLSETVHGYQQSLEGLEKIVHTSRENLSAFVVGAEEAKRSITNLDDVLDHLIETVRKSRLTVQRTAGQNATASESTHKARNEIHKLEETMSDSTTLLVHLKNTMSDLKIVASSIHEVAEDTKLLSLNAAIRSAKAQDEGRSFSVISHTIQDLATETQNAIHQLIAEIDALMNESAGLDDHVGALSESLSSAASEATNSTDMWRDTRSDLQSFERIEMQFEHFVADLRRYRDEVRIRQGKFEGQAQQISNMLTELSGALEQRLQQIREIGDRSEQIRSYATYEVSKGRFASDHLDQIRSMSLHVQNFLVDQVRSVSEIEQSLLHLKSGAAQNQKEANTISNGLQRLERAIRNFEEAFNQFSFAQDGQ